MRSRSTPIPDVVIDTNVVLSALVFGGGGPGALREHWKRHRCTPLLSTATAAELIRVLAYPKFKLTSAEQEDLLAEYLPWCRVVHIPNPPPALPDCRDPYDRPCLELALAGKADDLVTGDSDLHVLAEAFPCPIVNVTTFLESVIGG